MFAVLNTVEPPIIDREVAILLEEYPNLAAYVACGEARPAYKRAFAAQLAVFAREPPSS